MTLLKIALFFVLAMAAFFWVVQRSMLFPAPRVELPDDLPADVEILRFEQGYALLLPPLTAPTVPSPLLVFAHGNGEVAFWQIDDMHTVRAAGFHVLLLEYPGYASAPGRPSLESIKQSALAAFDIATARNNIDSSRVVAYGRSIGGGGACLIAAERPVAALGLESSFSTLSKLVAENRMPFFLLRDRFDNETIISKLTVPLFLYHGTQDNLIPIHHSERLARLAKTHEFVTTPCGHNDCPPGWNSLLEFLLKHRVTGPMIDQQR